MCSFKKGLRGRHNRRQISVSSWWRFRRNGIGFLIRALTSAANIESMIFGNKLECN
jgi:hypothetical protein